MSERGLQNVAQAEAETLRALEVGAWRVWQAGSGPLPAAYARWCAAEVERATAAMRQDCEANAKRAEAAEAEVARIRKLALERWGPEHLALSGDARTNDGDEWEFARRISGYHAGSVWSPGQEWFCRGVVRGLRWVRECNEGPAERADAGLPPEPAKPEVLPEHLAYLEALAEERSYMANVTDSSDQHGCDKAAHDMRAAVARRDGGVR